MTKIRNLSDTKQEIAFTEFDFYQQISGKLKELHNKMDAFKEEARNIYKEVYDKYCEEDINLSIL